MISKEYLRQWRKKNKLRVCYYNLKSNSKRRGIEFKLILQQFNDFCYETDYFIGRGRRINSYSIDRINPVKGYVQGNIQVLTVSENSKKGCKMLHYDYQSNFAIVRKRNFEEMGGAMTHFNE